MYAKSCQLCGQNKPIMHTLYSNLIPFPPPSSPWQRIGMDMITNLPMTKKTHSDCILVIINHFTKIEHFVSCKKTLNTSTVVDLFMDTVVQHHRLPATIVLDQDKVDKQFLETPMHISRHQTSSHHCLPGPIRQSN